MIIYYDVFVKVNYYFDDVDFLVVIILYGCFS